MESPRLNRKTRGTCPGDFLGPAAARRTRSSVAAWPWLPRVGLGFCGVNHGKPRKRWPKKYEKPWFPAKSSTKWWVFYSKVLVCLSEGIPLKSPPSQHGARRAADQGRDLKAYALHRSRLHIGHSDDSLRTIVVISPAYCWEDRWG